MSVGQNGHQDMNGGAPEAPADSLEGFVDVRFEDRKPALKFGFLPSLLSILSLAVMTGSSVYMAGQVSHPSEAFHQLKAAPAKRRQPVPAHQVTTFVQLFADLPCFFPGILYDLDKPTKAYEHCNTSHQCQEKKDCEKEPSALWTRLPFYFTVWGAGLGGTFEFVLLCVGKPFQFNLNPFTQWVRRLRLLNLAFVSTSIFFFSVCMTVPQENDVLLTILMYFLVAVAFALAPALFFGGFSSGGVDFIPFSILAIQAAEFIFIMSREAVFGGKLAKYVLAVAPVLQIAALLVTTETPTKSLGFHLLSTLSGFSIYVALELAGNESPSFPTDLETMLLGPETTKVFPFFIAAAAFGWFAMMTFVPKVHQHVRSEISYYLWSLLYYVLVGAPSQPMPYRLGWIYSTKTPKLITLQPYAQQHPYEVAPNLGIPAIYSENGALPWTIEANAGSLVQKVTGLFKIITRLDYFFPQANADAPLANKPRLSVTDDGQDKYPSSLFHCGLFEKFPDMGKSLQRCPEPAIEAYSEGPNLLAWLSQYGIGNVFLKKAVQTKVYPFYELVAVDEQGVSAPNTCDDGFVLDFRDLEEYEYKEDYEPYGGIAFCTVDEFKNLKVAWLVTPRSITQILPNEATQAFRRAESMIVSSLYFSVIAGKHLAHIHMTYNLLEVAAHNSFDVKLNENRCSESGLPYHGHPLRLYLYIHLFSHGLAEEMTTEHLVQEGGVFSQIFAIKYDSLCNYLTKEYTNFTYASDENFEYREKIMEPLKKVKPHERFGPPVSSAVEWEMEYFKIFSDYAKGMANAIYGSDLEVKEDAALQSFYKTLECYFNKMPARYGTEGFDTVDGVARFMADSTYHLVVRHQYYGTTAVSAALDPRLGTTQTPKDGGPPAVDEWRSLAMVALATAHANFVHIMPNLDENPDTLLQRPLEDIFDDATLNRGNAKDLVLVASMKKAWNVMQEELMKLNDKWIDDTHHHYKNTERVSPSNWKNDRNYMYCRPLPEDLHTGPGY